MEKVTKEDILSILDEVIEKNQSVYIFSSRFNSLHQIFLKIYDIIKSDSCQKTKKRRFAKLKFSLSKLNDNLTDLTQKDKCISYLQSNKSIPTLISEIESKIMEIFEHINKCFSQQFNIPSYAKYEDVQQIGDLLSTPEFEEDKTLDKRREEINKLYGEIQIPYKEIIEKYDKEQKYRLNSNDYTKSTEINAGDNYKEYEGTMNETNEKVTITVFDNPEHFKNEFRILTQIDHPCFNKMKGVVITESSVEIVTTRRGEPLKNHINHMNHMVTIIMFKIASAMSYLHSKRIVHRDLNIENIYIDNYESSDDSDDSDITKVTPIITNLNKSIYLPHSSFLGLPNINTEQTFSSPELISNYTYDEKADIFSFGGILYEIITGKSPFEDEIKEGQDMMQIIHDAKRPAFPNDFPENIHNLIEKCWAQRPNERPSFDQIVDQMSRDLIILPIDKNKEEEINKYYSTERIQNQNIIECSNSFDSCINDANRVYQFKCEFARAKPILFEYKHALRTSKYKSKETLDENEQSKINALTTQLNQLHDVIESARDHNLFQDDKKAVDFITIQLEKLMKNIYDLMKELGFNLQEYKAKKKDLISDFCDFDYPKCRNFFASRKINIKAASEEMNIYSQLQKIFLPFKKYEINRGDFYYENKIIGDGMESNVYKGINIKTGQKVAIKIVLESFFYNMNTLKYLRREIGILCQCKHKYLPEFIGYSISETGNKLWLISELIPDDNLYYLKFDLNEFQKTKIVFEIAEGMEYLHSQHILHRDLKTGNVMVLNGSPKIIDFGYSKSKIRSFSMTESIGTMFYMAPEVFKENQYGFPADVFSFGVLMWELYSGVYPFADNSSSEILNALANNERPPFELPIPGELKILIEMCWEGNPEQRPSFTEIINNMIEYKISYLNKRDEKDQDDAYIKMKRKIEEFYKEKKEERRNNINLIE